ncbi:MAG: MAE_28990/MAE_18760 family HEPN-like nuclease [Firmicutes bacterium]|nr:MAE_28990/MAE_18760 family HEPN-like nuclease [Bacillota bacterium]
MTSSTNTFASVFIEELEERWREIDILIDQIATSEDDVKNVLSRSAVVLLVAHLEGFVKEAASILVKDLNAYVQFKDLPKIVQKTYCSRFLSPINDSGGIDNRIQGKLLEEFSNLNAHLTVEPFLFDRNKNPSPSVIELVLGNFGVKDFFTLIHQSNLDVVFENNRAEILALSSELEHYLKSAVTSFPYNIDLDTYSISKKEQKLKREESLWVAFIDELLRMRHSIAHGSNFQNEIGEPQLVDAIIKVRILQYAIALVLFASVIE